MLVPAVALAFAPSVAAADVAPPAATTLALSAPAHAPATDPMTLSATLTDTAGPIPGEEVTFEREGPAGDTILGTASTDGAGTATLVVAAVLGEASYQASYAGDDSDAPATSNAVSTTGVQLVSTLRLSGPDSVVDGKSVSLHLDWAGPEKRPVPGVVDLDEKVGRGWRLVRRIQLDPAGRATVKVRPRSTTSFRAHGGAAKWWRAGTSRALTVKNLPPTAPVVLPAAAPRPETLPPQPRALASGARVTVRPIPENVWDDMTGKTWHAGCPVGREALRLLRVSYWGYDGYAHRGELVVAARVASNFAGAFAALYRGRFPVRAMYRVDRFGWSDRAHGGNDFAAMRHGDTSAFDCRWVDGRPGVTSPHAYGTALDLNTWENPYRSPQGYLPDSWWMAHADPRYAWRSRSAPVVRLLARYGFRWTYGLGDTQHFDVG